MTLTEFARDAFFRNISYVARLQLVILGGLARRKHSGPSAHATLLLCSCVTFLFHLELERNGDPYRSPRQTRRGMVLSVADGLPPPPLWFRIPSNRGLTKRATMYHVQCAERQDKIDARKQVLVHTTPSAKMHQTSRKYVISSYD